MKVYNETEELLSHIIKNMKSRMFSCYLINMDMKRIDILENNLKKVSEIFVNIKNSVFIRVKGARRKSGQHLNIVKLHKETRKKDEILWKK